MANFTNHGNRTTYEDISCSRGLDGKHRQSCILPLNIVISVTAILGNALIMGALPKVLSIHPSSKLLLGCLLWSDLSVGFILEPLYITFLLSQDHASLCYYFDTAHATTAVVFLRSIYPNYDCNKCGQTSRFVTGSEIQTDRNYKTSESLFDNVLAFEHGHLTNISIQRTINSYLDHLYSVVNLCGSFHLLLHENLLHAAP